MRTATWIRQCLTDILFSSVSSSFSLQWASPNIGLEPTQAALEKKEVDGFLDYLGALDPLPGSPPIPVETRHEFVRRYILEQLALAMAWEERAVYRAGSSGNSHTYYAHRVVAGWGQMLDLWEAGEEDAMGRARELGALILRGAR